MLSSSLKTRAEEAIKAYKRTAEAGDTQITIEGGRFVFLYWGADAEARATQAHSDCIAKPPSPLSGVEPYREGTYFFIV